MDELVFYFDRNFGKRLPNALAKLRPPVGIRWHQGQGYRQDMPDDEWMGLVGAKDWVVLTQDIKFHLIEHEIEHEIEAVKQHNIKCFYFADGQAGMWNTLGVFMRTHRKLMTIAHENSSPFIFTVKNNGVVKPTFLMRE
ncbi:MAG: hypothetical protein WA782_04185 [Sulfitobacter sp.]